MDKEDRKNDGTWQLKKLNGLKEEFEAIKKYGGNLSDEIIAYSRIRFEHLTKGQEVMPHFEISHKFVGGLDANKE